MPLFEVETEAHIVITWASDEEAAVGIVSQSYTSEQILRLTKRPRDTWVISKSVLGITSSTSDPCATARDCLDKTAGDKVRAHKGHRHVSFRRHGHAGQNHVHPPALQGGQKPGKGDLFQPVARDQLERCRRHGR